jgi:hypothetical protein
VLTRRRLLTQAAALAALPGLPVLAAADPLLRFEEMYQSGTDGVEPSLRLRGLAGSSVRMVGYMAPPLQAEADFFVLTREPLSLCPFCSSTADWPQDIVVVYLRRALDTQPFDRPVAVTGKLELGARMDPKTAMVSLVRLAGADCKPVG